MMPKLQPTYTRDIGTNVLSNSAGASADGLVVLKYPDSTAASPHRVDVEDASMQPEARQPCYRQLTFDSDVFKFPVASISPDVALHDLQAVIKDCTAHGMHLAYWAPKGGPIMALPDWFSGFAAGCNVLLRRELSSAFELRALPASSFRLSSMPAGPASCSVVELAFVAGQHSRFRTDPSLTRAQFERLYTAWADNSTQRKVAAEVIAAYDESATADGKPLGFITVQLQPRTSTASIGLLAVLPACQRQGLGALLMHAALSWASAAGAKQMEVVTQADNAPAIGLYTSHGFEQASSTTTYHIWLDAPQHIRQNVPYFTGREVQCISAAMEAEDIRSSGNYSTSCQRWLREHMGAETVLLTGSGTTALEQAALLCDFQPGDEVIMPSFTFVSTANAFVLRGATPVFVDVQQDNLNIDISTIWPALSERTRAVVVVHYAGVAVDMDPIMQLAQEKGLIVVEDNAHGFLSTYKGRYLGTIGHFGCLSFHYTKNIICGEGGALIINDSSFKDRAHIMWEKGTNRFDFIKKKVDKYEWIDLGSSFVPSELVGCFLYPQLHEAEEINSRRQRVSVAYHHLLQPLEALGALQLMTLDDGTGNGHIFWLIMPNQEERNCLAKALEKSNIEAYGHYVPLHLSQGGRRWGRTAGSCALPNTIAAGSRLIRLPLWPHMTCAHVYQVVRAVYEHIGKGVACPSLGQVVQLYNLR